MHQNVQAGWQRVMQQSSQTMTDREQARAVRQASVLCPLASLCLVRVAGADAASFLHGQLSSDVRLLDGSTVQYSSYSTAKGRVLGTFLLWKSAEDYYFLLAADIADAIVRRLSMFVLRARVNMAICPSALILGVQGADAQRWLQGQCGVLPAAPLRLCCHEDIMLLRTGSGALLAVQAEGQWQPVDIPAAVLPVSEPAWSLLDIAAGIPWVTMPTREEFVAQMLNLDLIGGISFTKGCYPGQEIIARTHYLGKIKRRMYRVQFSCQCNSGSALYSPATGDQAIGMVVMAARNQDGLYEGLAVISSASWDDGVFADSDYQYALEKLSLPYALNNE